MKCLGLAGGRSWRCDIANAHGKKFEDACAKDGALPDLASVENVELKCISQLLKDLVPADTDGQGELWSQRGNCHWDAQVDGDGCKEGVSFPMLST